jgi:hypothetical protein
MQYGVATAIGILRLLLRFPFAKAQGSSESLRKTRVRR